MNLARTAPCSCRRRRRLGTAARSAPTRPAARSPRSPGAARSAPASSRSTSSATASSCRSSPRQLDRDYLLVTQISQGIGELGLDGGASIRSDLVRFHREGDRVELWVVNPTWPPRPGTPMARTVAYSFGHSVAQSFPIAADRDDERGPGQRRAVPRLRLGRRRHRVPDRDRAAEADRQRIARREALQPPVAPPLRRQPRGRGPAHLPDAAQPRPRDGRRLSLDPDRHPLLAARAAGHADAPPPGRRAGGLLRLGHQGFLARHRGELLRPLREPLAAGEEASGRGAERAGAADHLLHRPHGAARVATVRARRDPRVEPRLRGRRLPRRDPGARRPDDSAWSAADARYSTVRWTANNGAVYAIAPTNVDPRTGEILNADILDLGRLDPALARPVGPLRGAGGRGPGGARRRIRWRPARRPTPGSAATARG